MKNLILKPISRPHWHLTDMQKMCLDLSLFVPKSKDELYMFVVDRKCTIQHAKQMAKQLFADPEASDYLTERQKWIDEEWFGVEDGETAILKPTRLTKEERQELAELMLDKFLKSPDVTDPTMLKKALDFALDKVEENRDEKPRIYVPLKCSICPYEHFCRTQGESVCPRCRFREFALANGCEDFKYTELLTEPE